MAATASESAEHLRLKRMALVWAQAQGFPVAATEVSLPSFGFRLDAAAYRPARETIVRADADTRRPRRLSVASVGLTALFECKASRPDYLRDSRSLSATSARLERLFIRKEQQENILRLHYPSIRNGDSLFAEYETLDFRRPGYEEYERTLAEIHRLTVRLHSRTKFDKLAGWRAANLHYIVAEEGLLRAHELPAGWGLLVRNGEALEVAVRPIFAEVEAAQRLLLLYRIAMAATRTSNAAHGIGYEDVERTRRNLPMREI